MNDIRAKVRHVLAAGQTRRHHCHWPDCSKQVPPAKWGCKPHWYLLPQSIRNRIWNAYRPGQEITVTPSREYMDAARAADDFAREYIRKNQKQDRLI